MDWYCEQGCPAERVSLGLCCSGGDGFYSAALLGLGPQAGLLVPREHQAGVLGRTLSLRFLGFWPHPVLAVHSPDVSDSTCCQHGGAVRVQQSQAFALSSALPAACLVLCSAAPVSPLKPSPKEREVQPEPGGGGVGGQRLALTARRSDGGTLQAAASGFPPCLHPPSPLWASRWSRWQAVRPLGQALCPSAPGTRHPSAASWKTPAPTASLQRELSSFFSPLERAAGRLPGLRGST